MDSGNQTPADQVKEIHPTVVTGPAGGNIGAPVLQIDEVVAERYKVLKLLGHGGMGSVYKVEHVIFRQLFALKTLSGQNYPEVAIRRFQKEAQAAMKLNHTNLVRAHDFGILPSHHPFYIMDLIEGENLSEYSKRVGIISFEEILRIFIPVCFALAYAHSEGIVHRDIKPGNIMLDKSGGLTDSYIPKVVDFGIAKLTDSESGESVNLTRTGEIFGTPLYMSPEQCLGTKIDHRTDIYSLGCVIYEVLTGAPPFHGESALNLMLKHQTEKPASLKEGSMGREFPEALEKIVARTLEKDPDRRYQNFLDLAEALAVLQRSGGEPATNLTLAKTLPQIVKPVSSRTGARFWKSPIVLAIAGMLFGLLIGYMLPKQAGPVTEKPEEKPEETESAASLVFEQDRVLISTGQYFQKLDGSGPGALRVFKFPNTFSLGSLQYVDKWGNLIQNRSARGIVEIPISSPVNLSVRQEDLRMHPNLLKGFGDYDINNLHLARASTTNEGFAHNADIEFDAALAFCSRWKALSFLNVYDTTVTDVGLRAVRDCPSLINLALIETSCTAAGVRELRCYPDFATIDISGIAGGKSLIEPLSRSKRLNNIGIKNLDLTDDDVRQISTAKGLVIMNLGNNRRVTDESVKYLKQLPLLTELNVAFTSISPKSIAAFASMKNLRKLSVGKDLWTSKEVRKLHDLAPNLQLNEFAADDSG